MQSFNIQRLINGLTWFLTQVKQFFFEFLQRGFFDTPDCSDLRNQFANTTQSLSVFVTLIQQIGLQFAKFEIILLKEYSGLGIFEYFVRNLSANLGMQINFIEGYEFFTINARSQNSAFFFGSGWNCRTFVCSKHLQKQQ
ncbi:unnamed protein product (macronuclear) [Paramecium tetraurelia]|uniref:Uncharacterized protein n=1 Tax=Paramecium tetraurelia TaxID=5888 RepID=A0CQ79_PARTE|nr:uncharacterized protein GSPATT00009294001 [Paramecium tetraurelia]CAK72946.1 unnamed protein product [Paramecium tetraurelia]|eukprot:XP_001440343.1 hypothetical protein (macronuclear) [Paramecium tetraurelia strain d4-2]